MAKATDRPNIRAKITVGDNRQVIKLAKMTALVKGQEDVLVAQKNILESQIRVQQNPDRKDFMDMLIRNKSYLSSLLEDTVNWFKYVLSTYPEQIQLIKVLRKGKNTFAIMEVKGVSWNSDQPYFCLPWCCLDENEKKLFDGVKETNRVPFFDYYNYAICHNPHLLIQIFRICITDN